MKKEFKKIAASFMAIGFMVSVVSIGATAYAATESTGSAAALSKADYSLTEMLTYAIEDEYLAQAEYYTIMNSLGVQRPFSNIVKAETTHIDLLTPLLSEYNVALPSKDWVSLVTTPTTFEAAVDTGINAEKNNIAMYEKFLKTDLPDDVKEVFTLLLKASERHLAAFERQADGVCTGGGCGNGKGNKAGAGNRSGRCEGSFGKGNSGFGQGNRGSLQGSCILD